MRPDSEGTRGTNRRSLAVFSSFANTTLVVVHEREMTVGRLLSSINESASPRRAMQRSNSESACRKRAGRQVRAPEIEVSEPRIQQAVRVGQRLDRLARLPALQRDQAFDDLAVGLRLGGQFWRDSAAASGRALSIAPASTKIRAARNRTGIALLFSSALSAAAMAGLFCPGHEVRVRDRGELDGRSVRILCRQIAAAPCSKIRTASAKRPS